MHGKIFVVQKAQVGGPDSVTSLSGNRASHTPALSLFLICEENLMLSTNDIIIHLRAIHEPKCVLLWNTWFRLVLASLLFFPFYRGANWGFESRKQHAIKWQSQALRSVQVTSKRVSCFRFLLLSLLFLLLLVYKFQHYNLTSVHTTKWYYKSKTIHHQTGGLHLLCHSPPQPPSLLVTTNLFS